MNGMSFLERLQKGERLLADGAWGTELSRRGLVDGECPEAWNGSHAEEIRDLARQYFEAGADMGLTNTYGGNKFRLKRHGLANCVRDINLAGARLSREVADRFGAFVAGSVGPSGEFVEPRGLISRDEMYEAYLEQIRALKDGGVEAIVVETFFALEEVELPIKAAKDLGLFCMATMTFDRTPTGYKSTLGVTPPQAARALEAFGADVVGTNCGHGVEEMVELTRAMRPHTKRPMLLQSNAGRASLVHGAAVYGESPEWMASRIPELFAAGASIVGGCCGTTPAHIRRFRAAMDAMS